MSANVVKGELSQRLRAALRNPTGDAAERLLERSFWSSPAAPDGGAASGRSAPGGLLIALPVTGRAAGR